MFGATPDWVLQRLLVSKCQCGVRRMRLLLLQRAVQGGSGRGACRRTRCMPPNVRCRM